jgi:O-antigen ligase
VGYTRFTIQGYSPHNSYLAAFAYHGIIGAALFLFIILYPLVRSISPDKVKQFPFLCLLFIVAGFLIQQNFETQIGLTFYFIHYLFFFLLGFLRFYGKRGEPNLSHENLSYTVKGN